ncbi:hypothetical protein D3C86_1723770 [compost metagenome]
MFDQRMILPVVQRGEDAARAIVTFDGVPLDTAANDLCAFKHHAAEQTGAFGAITLFNDVDIAAVGVHQLPAVTSAGTETDAGRLQHHHVVPRLYQKQRR